MQEKANLKTISSKEKAFDVTAALLELRERQS